MGQRTTTRGRRPYERRDYSTSLRGRWNAGRYRRIAELARLEPTDRILDLGCGIGGKSLATYNRVNPILGLDRFPPHRLLPHGPNFDYLQGDARRLDMFGDGSFDVVTSIGLLEHIESDDDRRAVILEAARVGRRFVHVVPHKWGFIEPHLKLPLFGAWPDWLRSLVLRGLRRKRADERWRSIRWPSRAEWQRLFEGTRVRIHDHWYGPLLMSYIIVGERGGSASKSSCDSAAGHGRRHRGIPRDVPLRPFDAPCANVGAQPLSFGHSVVTPSGEAREDHQSERGGARGTGQDQGAEPARAEADGP